MQRIPTRKPTQVLTKRKKQRRGKKNKKYFANNRTHFVKPINVSKSSKAIKSPLRIFLLNAQGLTQSKVSEVEELLEKSYDTEYYDYDEDTTGLINYDTKDSLPDNASDRGGPRRRRRPGNQRKRQGLGPRPNALVVRQLPHWE